VIADDVDILVVGAPTHAFGMSRPTTRAEAARRAPARATSTAVGVRDWLDSLTCATHHPVVATFDTRIRRPHVPGSAARAVRQRLVSLGLTPTSPPMTFHVAATAGPLLAGELKRARRWGSHLADYSVPSRQHAR
jgi:hypothetical protein